MAEEAQEQQGDLAEASLGGTALWRRLKQHRIAQWSVGYVAVAYGIQHAVTLTIEAMDWPHGLERASLILLALGLPVAITLAWYRGDQASRGFSRAEFSILAVLLLGVSILFYVFVRPAEPAAPVVVAAKPASASAPAKAAAPPVPMPSGPSVAVLPFLNLSGDPKEEYFSDGMTEEITSALAKIPNLPVVGRTSAFAFKGKNEDLRVIGQALGATYLLEGSVRKAGDRVRITAQLIKAETGDHIWTDSYDRNLTDIFAVQEDVAKAIAAALQVPLGLKQGESLIANRDIDPESYQDYLRAKALYRAREFGKPLTTPITMLESVVARQPDYAPAWALLAQAYSIAPIFDTNFFGGSSDLLRRSAGADLPKAEAAARRAITLDPRDADAYTGLGLFQTARGQLLEAEQSFKHALALDSLNSDTLQEYSIFLAMTGDLKTAVAMRKQLRALDPLVPAFNGNTAQIIFAAGDNAGALALVQAMPPSGRANVTAMIYAAMKKYKEAADALLAAPRELLPPGAVETAARLLRMAPAQATSQNIPDLGGLSWVFAYVGLPERALEFDEHLADAGFIYNGFYAFWQSDNVVVRKTDRFKILVRNMGLVDYWRAKGWPDLCHPTTGDDFACN